MLKRKMTLTKDVLPQHVGIIMDGNGRWAKRRGLPRAVGHSKGGDAFRSICRYASEIGLQSITFYAFSTENWKRPQQEVDAIMDLLRDYLQEAEAHEKENENTRIFFIGERTGLPEDILRKIDECEVRSADKKGTTVNIALNYGGQDEIVHSVQKIAEDVRRGKLDPEDITKSEIEKHLYTRGQPNPDFIIRPSGEYRLSNFLLWQSAYAELYFTPVLWPDFSVKEFKKALQNFSRRNRRFGGI